MQLLGLDIAQIVDLGTQVAQAGAIRTMELVGDDVFEYAIAIAILIYEQDTTSQP